MRIRRSIIIPAILTLSTAGSVLAASTVSLVAAQAPSSVVATARTAHPDFVYQG
jgi:hypothetical protein